MTRAPSGGGRDGAVCAAAAAVHEADRAKAAGDVDGAGEVLRGADAGRHGVRPLQPDLSVLFFFYQQFFSDFIVQKHHVHTVRYLI